MIFNFPKHGARDSGFTLIELMFVIVVLSVIGYFVFYWVSPKGQTTGNGKFIEIVASKGLNVRTGPSTNFDIIATLNHGEIRSLIESQNGWHQIQVDKNSTGWVSGTYSRVTKSGFLTTIEILLMGLLIIGTIFWQYKLLESDKKISHHKNLFVDIFGILPQLGDVIRVLPKRIVIPIVFSIVVLVGVLGFGVISLVDSNKHYPVGTFFKDIMVATIFGLTFVFKSYLGPIVIGFTAAFTIYFLFEYGQFQPIPIISSVIGWIFSKLPPWLENIYVFSLGAYIIGASTVDTFDFWN